MPFLNDEKEYTRNPLMEGFAEGHFETNDGVKLRYLHKGEGMPFIMLHGYSDDADCWMLNAPEFAKYFSVYCPDLRGHGYSVTDHGAHVSRLAADIHEMVEAIGEPKVNLLGWSMGSAVVWSYLELFGESSINKVIFDDEAPALAASPRSTKQKMDLDGTNVMDPWYLPEIVEKHGCGWADGGSPFFDAFSSCFRNGHPAYGDLEMFEEIAKALPDNYMELMGKRPPMNDVVPKKFMADLLLNHLMLDWWDLMPTIKCPVLYLSGDVSHATTVAQGERLQKMIPQMEWVRFSAEEFGIHDLNQTCYKKFNRVVLEFLNK